MLLQDFCSIIHTTGRIFIVTRYHSPSHNRGVTLPDDVKDIPSSWKECKDKGIDICEIRQIKQIRKKGK